MRNFFVGLLLVGFFSMPAIAENDISADSVFEKKCENYGLQKGSGDFELCMKDYRKDVDVPKNESAVIAGHASANTVSVAPPESDKKAAQMSFCDNYGYSKSSAEYAQCLEFAAQDGYAGEATKYQEAGQISLPGNAQTGRRKKVRQ